MREKKKCPVLGCRGIISSREHAATAEERATSFFTGLTPTRHTRAIPRGLNCIHYASRRRQPTNFLTEKK